ncbi:transglutaminase domain-containing protein [Demequina sp.]|uniref:transglutaminase domain-containing protein n=1 Tax=Demequina sp. TaxID=2050685 RepID=UPI0025C6A0B3|nr:transglutaminase domain-containing protein [Demequina sp.]
MTHTDDGGAVRRPRLPEPGWLPDPSRLDIERYWDGSSWTSRTRDRVSKLERIPATGWVDEPRRGRHPGRWFVSLVVVGLLAFGGAGYAGMLPSWMPAPSGLGLGPPAGPAVAYPVFGSNNTVTYLARSLVAQQQEIDVTWIQAQGADVMSVVEDAMGEVLSQNPYVFVSGWSVKVGTAKSSLRPEYTYSADEAERRRVATASAVQAVLATPDVQSAQGDRATVEALHDAVLRAATYDRAAYDAINAGETTASSGQVAQSQEAYGILVEGTAVCNGYAQAMQLLAEAAGLESVVVNGMASSGFTTGAHAWNKVRVDGEWLVVDATWDDADDARLGRDYLLLDPLDAKLSTRTAGDEWVVDANAGLYG